MKFSSDTIIGLEVHVELNTETKLFCACARKGSDEPNTRTCPICLGHPGSKPVLNKTAVEYALKLAVATGCKVSKHIIFSRKSYFYPDMAKNYQISQYEEPLAQNGKITLSSGKEIRLKRIHMEEDPAALVHPFGIGGGYLLVDYNRSGNPLVEVVTEPELTSPEEARDFMKQLLSILSYLKIFDLDSCIVKADANISIKESGYTRVEIKNITGFKEIERALKYELERHRKTDKIHTETRAWDSSKGITFSLRSKESEEDYGYIFDPDLPPVHITEDMLENIYASIPELARDKKERFIKYYNLPADDAAIISAQIEMAELFEKVAAKISPRLAAKWLRRELARVMNYNSIDFADLQIDETHLIELLELVERKEITDATAQKILEMLIEKPFKVREYVEAYNLKVVSDEDSIEKWCREAINENPEAVADYKKGQEKSLNFIIGKVMRKSRGTADPARVRSLLSELIKNN